MGCGSSKDDLPDLIPRSYDSHKRVKRSTNNNWSNISQIDDNSSRVHRNYETIWQARVGQFRIEVWVDYSAIISSAGAVQLQLLQYLDTLLHHTATCIEIRCIDHTVDTGNGTVIFLHQMLRLQTKGEILDFCNKIPPDTPHDMEIRRAVTVIASQPTMEDTMAQGIVKGPLLVALASLSNPCGLEEFRQWVEQKKDFEVIDATWDLKIQSQILAQTRYATEHLKTHLQGKPTIFVNFLPWTSAFSAKRNVLQAIDKFSQEVGVRGSENITTRKDRQDLIGFQFVEFVTGQEFNFAREADDFWGSESGITDSILINISRLENEGPGIDLPAKILLGAVDSNLERGEGKEIYGMGWDLRRKELF